MKDDPQDAEEFVAPNGQVIIDDLPNDIADVWLEDELICGNIGGKSPGIAAIDAARRGDIKEASRILMVCRERAGEAALNDWITYMREDEPDV